MTEWFTQQQAAYIGAFVGSGAGVLGAALGMMMGLLAPKGKCKGLVLALHATGILAGLAALLTGIVALASGQPYHVWYPFLLGGVIVCGVLGPLFPVVRARYRYAEQRRLGAEELRRA